MGFTSSKTKTKRQAYPEAKPKNVTLFNSLLLLLQRSSLQTEVREHQRTAFLPSSHRDSPAILLSSSSLSFLLLQVFCLRSFNEWRRSFGDVYETIKANQKLTHIQGLICIFHFWGGNYTRTMSASMWD